jgi:hypothetical protein
MAMREWRRRSRAAVLALSAGLFVVALFVFLRAHSYSAYQEARAEAKSIESAFPLMDRDLRSAARFPGHPMALGELGRIYLERAFAEIQFGSGEKREEYLDKARDAFVGQIRANPLDANAFYRMGIVYTLYNYPLRTYADRGWPYIIRALELSPSDEFLNANGLYIFLAQWDALSQKERGFVWARLKEIVNLNPFFISKIANLWKANQLPLDDLKKILSADAELWPRLQKYF